MTEEDALQIFKEIGAVIEGTHVVLRFGDHTATYFEKKALYKDGDKTRQLCCKIAKQFVNDNVEAVIGPVTGGKTISRLVADYLTITLGREIHGLYVEKRGEEFVVNDNYHQLIAGKRVLVVDDALTTGGSVRKVIAAVQKISGNVIGLGVLWNRGSITAQDVSVPKLVALVNKKLEIWNYTDCQLCKQNIPINISSGHGREFLARHSQEG